jgi:dihydrofolate reductase
MTKLALIVAMDESRGIGKNNDLMWNLPNDMKFFKEMTNGQIVVMGRKNYDSIPERFRPLPNRENCVITRNPNFEAPGCKVFHTLQDCIDAYKEDERTLFIIGGGEIYRLAMETLPLDELYITAIDHTFGADTFLCNFDETPWKKTSIQRQIPDERHAFGFTIYKYFK